MSDLDKFKKEDGVAEVTELPSAPAEHREAEILDFQETIDLLGAKNARIAMQGLKITDQASDAFGIIACTIKTVDLLDDRFKDAKKYKCSAVDGKINFEPVTESFL